MYPFSNRTTWKDLANGEYGFEQYLAEHKHILQEKWSKGTDEYFNRESIFLTELARVRLHNTMGKSWYCFLILHKKIKLMNKF